LALSLEAVMGHHVGLMMAPAHPHHAHAASASPLFVVFNPAAGRDAREELAPAVEAACAAVGLRFEVLAIERPRGLADTAREAVRRARATGGTVVAAGGDGTVNGVAQEVLGSGCRFGVLPRGTFNYFARTHGIPPDLPGALHVLLNEAAMPVQVGRLNERVFLVNASLGLYPRLLEDREAWKQQFGRSRLVAFGAGIATLLRGHRSLRLTVELQGQSREVRTPTLFVGNNALQLEQVGLPQAQAVDAGLLAGVVLKPVGRWSLLALLARGAFGQLGEADQVVHFAFRRLTVTAGTFGARRIKVATDGEVLWMPLPLRFEVAPLPLLLIRPPGLAEERRSAQAASASGEVAA
jgi:diacylglycerol kinase family enzyme